MDTLSNAAFLLPLVAACNRRWWHTAAIVATVGSASTAYHVAQDAARQGCAITSPTVVRRLRTLDRVLAHGFLLHLAGLLYHWVNVGRHRRARASSAWALLAFLCFGADCARVSSRAHTLWHIVSAIGAMITIRARGARFIVA